MGCHVRVIRQKHVLCAPQPLLPQSYLTSPLLHLQNNASELVGFENVLGALVSGTYGLVILHRAPSWMHQQLARL